MGEGILDGLVFGLTGALPRKQVETTLKANGASMSAIIHKRVAFVVCTTDAVKYNTQKIRKAGKHGISLVSQEFVEACVRAGHVVDHTPFLIAGDQTKTPAKKAAAIKTLPVGENPQLELTLTSSGEHDGDDTAGAKFTDIKVRPQGDARPTGRDESDRERNEQKLKIGSARGKSSVRESMMKRRRSSEHDTSRVAPASSHSKKLKTKRKRKDGSKALGVP